MVVGGEHECCIFAVVKPCCWHPGFRVTSSSQLHQLYVCPAEGECKNIHTIYLKDFALCCEVIYTYVLMIKTLPCKRHQSESDAGPVEAERLNFWYSLVIRAS